MIITHQRQTSKKKNTMGVVAAGLAGAVAIAGVAVAATVALQDEKTRKKVKKVLGEVKDQAVDYIDKLTNEPTPETALKTVKKAAASNAAAAKKVVKEKI